MADQTYAITHVVGTSTTGVDDAIRNGIKTASKSLRNLDWFEVDEIRGYLGGGDDVQHVQVTMKIGFRYED
jgi:flavin-binding protein dodecin